MQEGYKNIVKHFQLSASTLRNIIKKLQLTGTVEVEMRFGRPRKL